MPSAKTLDSWLAPPATGKRKRAANVDYTDDTSDKENDVSEKKAPPKKKQTKSTTTIKAKATTGATKSKTGAAGEGKAAKKLYADTLKAIDKGIDDLDKRVKKMNPNSWAITIEDYAEAANKHLPIVKKLATDDPVLAFNLLLSMADASATDLDASIKMSGESEATDPMFRRFDNALLSLIDARDAPKEKVTELPYVKHRWTRDDADVGVFKTGWPNAQQRNQMDRQRLAWEKERRVKRRERRGGCEDWVAVALSDLKEERDYLKQYGVEKYLPLSIAKLEVMCPSGHPCNG